MEKLTLEEAIKHAKKVAVQMELDDCKDPYITTGRALVEKHVGIRQKK